MAATVMMMTFPFLVNIVSREEVSREEEKVLEEEIL